MRIALPAGAAPGEPLAAHLRRAFPRYTVTMRGGAPILGDGLATGVMLKPAGPGQVEAVWAFPSVIAQLLVTLTILAGLLPGLVLFLVVWLVTRGGVARLQQEIATVLAGGSSPQAGLPPPGATSGARPTVATLVAAGACFVLGLSWLVGRVASHMPFSPWSFSGLFWFALGAGAILLHGEEQRPSPQRGPGTLVLGVSAVLIALAWLTGHLFRPLIDVWFFLDILSSLLWLAAGATLLHARTQPPAPGKPSPLLLVIAADGVLSAVLVLLNLNPVLSNGSNPALDVPRLALSALAWLTLAGGLVGRYLAHAQAPSAAAPAYAALPPGAGPAWRVDPLLAGRFHQDHPDDLQVLLHDGEPRRTQRTPEACWVHVEAVDGLLRYPTMAKDGPPPPLAPEAAQWIDRPVYRGKLLNQPHALTESRQGDDVLFVHAPGIPHPLQVRPAYLAERPLWAFAPCDRCGADQALDPPTVMAATRFPGAPPGMQPLAFTAFCPCGGTMMLSALSGPPAAAQPAFAQPAFAPPAFAQPADAQPAFAPPPLIPAPPARAPAQGGKTALILGGVAVLVLLLGGAAVIVAFSLREPPPTCFSGDVEDTGAPGHGWATVGIPKGALRCVPASAAAGAKQDRVMFRAESEEDGEQALTLHVLAGSRVRVATPSKLLDEEREAAKKGRPQKHLIFAKAGGKERVAFVGTFRKGLYAVSAYDASCSGRVADPICPEEAQPAAAKPSAAATATGTAPAAKPGGRAPVGPPRRRPGGAPYPGGI
jgi:hypothetical protein